MRLETVKKWFGYNRQERRSSIILIVLIAVVLLVRVSVPGSRMEVVELIPGEELPGSVDTFDPNNASFDTLLKAGFNEREARTLMNYRNAGAVFRQPSDIRKLYGLDSVKAERLIPLIKIADVTISPNSKSYQKKLLLELNSCDSSALERLPGIGPVLSSRIIKYRNLLGGFVSVSQLKEVYGLPPETFQKISPMLYTDTALVKKININTADYAALTRLPYLRRFHLTDILRYRELQGKISSVDELVKNNIIPDTLADRIHLYIKF